MRTRWTTWLRRPTVAGLLVVLAALAACGNPFERPTPLSQWGAAMVRDDYNTAQRLLTPADAAGWRAQTDQLRQQHGGIRSYQKGDLPPPPGAQKPIAVIRLTWDDGYDRCLLAQETEDRHIALLDGGYQDCAGVPQL